VLRTFHGTGYTVTVYEAVFPHWLQRGKPFQQVVFAPATALPAHVDQTIDMDGDGKPDLRLVFDLPSDPNAPLHGSVEALNAKYRSVANLGNNSFTELLVRADSRILLRVPLAGKK
jgi:hypothetical protein